MPIHVRTEESKTSLFVQTPKLLIYNDVCEGTEKRAKYIEFATMDENFLNEVRTLENEVLTKLKTEKEELFPNKGIDDIFLEAGQTSCVLAGNLCRCRLPKDVQVWSYRKEALDVSSLQKEKAVVCILQVSSVWFTTSRWGVILSVCQVRQEKEVKERVPKAYMFPENESEDESVSEEEDMIEPPPPEN
jgi:hypothetical protein